MLPEEEEEEERKKKCGRNKAFGNICCQMQLEKIVFTRKHVHLASPFDIELKPLTPLGSCHM